MSELILKARVRKRDKDIAQALDRLKLEEGEKADMIRDGFRKVLAEMGALSLSKSIEPNTQPVKPAIKPEVTGAQPGHNVSTVEYQGPRHRSKFGELVRNLKSEGSTNEKSPDIPIGHRGL